MKLSGLYSSMETLTTAKRFTKRLLATTMLAATVSALSGAYHQSYSAHPRYITKITPATASVRTDSQYYTVQQGDVLERILKQHGLQPTRKAVHAVVALNEHRYPLIAKDVVGVEHNQVVHKPDGEQGDVLVPGQRLLLGIQADTLYTPARLDSIYTGVTTQFSPKPAAALLLSIATVGAVGAAAMLKKPRPRTGVDAAIDAYLGRYDTSKATYDHTVAAVCAQAGVSRKALYAALHERGLGTRSQYRQLTSEYRRNYVRASTRTAAQLAEELGVRKSTIYKYRSTAFALSTAC